MKRIFTTMLISMMTFVGVMAQLNIWYNGAVVYQRDYTLIDSITFTIQNPTSPTDITENLPTKVENMIGSPDSEVRSTMQAAGYSIQDEFTSNEDLFLTFVNSNEDTIKCVFRQSNLLTDVNAIMHFSSGSSPLNIYKDWSATAYNLTSWEDWQGYIRELPRSDVQYFSGRTLFTNVLNSMTTANYVAEECTYDRDNYASLSFLKGGLISRIEYARAYRYLDVVPTAISLPDTLFVMPGQTMNIPYEVQPHGALLSYITATTDDPSIAGVNGTQLTGNNVGVTTMRVSCGTIQKTVVIICGQEGMYIVGAATAVANLYSANSKLALMAQGVNERLIDNGLTYDQAKRNGMYEKYLYLDANKPFSFVYLDGTNITNYGGQLVAQDILYDYGYVPGYWCALEENVQMQVPVAGFYHVVLDLNQNEGDLDAAGGAQIIIAPVSWGISGGMNGWGTTEGVKGGDQNLTTWTWENVEIPGNSEFKFKDAHGWKIWLDGENDQVSVSTNLGADMIPSGNNIFVDVQGVYTITLSWQLAAGDIANSYSYQLVKTGDLVFNPAEFIVGISGGMNGWSDPTGAFAATYDADASTITDQTTKAGTYVYKMEGVTFPAESTFKFRFNGAWLGFGAVDVVGVTAEETSYDQLYTGIVGTYDIVITAVWDGEKTTSLTAVFTEGTPVDLTDIAISAIVPEGWEHCYLWAWDSNGNIFDAEGWPGKELEINAGKVAYNFMQVAAPLNVVFSNGGGAQTYDITDVKDGAEIDIQANLK